VLGDIYKLLKKNFIFESLTNQFVAQLFYFVDAQLLNALLKRPELYKCSAGFQIKMAISQVESSVGKVDKKLVSIARYDDINTIY
jgi:hypothetical protein